MPPRPQMASPPPAGIRLNRRLRCYNTSKHLNKMPSLLLIVLVVEAAVHIINLVGAATLNNLVREHYHQTVHSIDHQQHN